MWEVCARERDVSIHEVCAPAIKTFRFDDAQNSMTQKKPGISAGLSMFASKIAQTE